MLKTANLLHKCGVGDSDMNSTVKSFVSQGNVSNYKIKSSIVAFWTHTDRSKACQYSKGFTWPFENFYILHFIKLQVQFLPFVGTEANVTSC